MKDKFCKRGHSFILVGRYTNGHCKECTREYKRKKYKENPDYRRDMKIRWRYGITVEDYNRLFKEQNGSCAICGVHQSQLPQRLDIDHDHSSKKVRGLLCRRCNRAIGEFKDNVEILSKAIEYLKGKVNG